MKTISIIIGFLFAAIQAHAAFQLPPSQPCAAIAFRLVDNRAVYDVTVEGKGPYHFIFDTGANSILDAALARELGVALDDIGQTGGAGAGTQSTWRTRLGQVSFGGITARDVDFMSLDLSSIRKAIGFERLDGLMGREVLAQYLVRYDYNRSTLMICDPDRAPKELRAGVAFKFRLGDFNMPVVEATLDGRKAEFIVDTGDRSSLTLFGPYVDRHNLREAYSLKVSTITGQGVGGPIPAEVVRAGSLAFSGFDLAGVTTRMPTLTSGAFASAGYAGSIGNGVMRRFNVTFDYRARTMYLQPNVTFAKPDRYDRSGMWLTGETGDGFTVAAVSHNGPAAKAGIAPGDLIVAVDGVAAAKISLIALRDRLMDAPRDTKVHLTLRSSTGAQREATVALTDQI